MNGNETSGFQHGRLRREHQTFVAMMECYCQDHHGQHEGRLCHACQEVMDYATLRLIRCRFGAEKPTCARCPVHCYQRDYRERVREIMRYAGPRMLWRHPVLAVLHLLDGLRSPSPQVTALAAVVKVGQPRHANKSAPP